MAVSCSTCTSTPFWVKWEPPSGSISFSPVRLASTTMPPSIVIAIPPRRARVVAAFLLFGSRNAGTPLEIASTPVSAAQPDEKDRATRMIRAIPVRSS